MASSRHAADMTEKLLTGTFSLNTNAVRGELFFGFLLKRPGKQFFSHVGTEPLLPGYFPVLWGV